ncbi:envelope integrity protein Cei [Amycolatopsis cynarae]|uniref:Envelope integrity protein Cei n=1 Tax=Amycolatopsis cynarae TaxID=2995223 RepID=A0ABY7B635_9PSEU|nr:envelope integrity protein Cei [Amycolatopsis sp. HUAS 11-8]WAL67626.1 envelope integrity protein Cei [Amycolatopsis sp. HUAS 11-8]
MASGIGLGNRKKRGYRRRRPLPAVIFIGVLGLVAMVIWVRAITSRADIDAVLRCDPGPTPAQGMTFTSLSHSALDDIAPVPPDKVAVKVLNASQLRGQAAITTEGLRELGFTQIAQPENDPYYPKDTAAKCRGQIRFGDNGVSAARTLSLVLPCVELVKDTRADASVDLSIGGTFGDIRPTQQARQILQQLQTWSTQHSNGNEQSAPGSPVLDPALLAAARNVAC